MNHLIFILLIPLFFSCTKQTKWGYQEWNDANNSESLKQILNVSTETKKSIVLYNGQEVKFVRQTYEGIPVYGSFLKTVSKDGSIVAASAQSLNFSEKLKTVKTYGHDEVKAILKKYDKSLEPIEIIDIEKVIYDFAGRPEVLYKVSFFKKTGEPYELFIDAKKDVTVAQRAGSNFGVTDVATTLFPEGPKLSALLDMTLKGMTSTLTLSSANVIVASESSQKINEILPKLKFSPEDDRFDQLQVFYYISKTLNWARENLLIELPVQLQATTYIGFPEKTNAAFYYQNRIKLGKGDGEYYVNIAQDASIVSHETFHAIIESLSRLPFEGEGGSLNEAYADFFTCVMLNRPYMGESSYLKDSFKRSISNSTNLSEKNGGLYHDSLIISGLLWELKEKLGTTKATTLALETLIKLNPVSKFTDFNLKLKEVARKKLDSDEQKQMDEILLRRGF
jgi:Zn-dependent metalloprotease